MTSRSPRAQSRGATITVATVSASEPAAPEANTLQFDFEGQRVRAKASAQPSSGERDTSIKETIIRWLNEQL